MKLMRREINRHRSTRTEKENYLVDTIDIYAYRQNKKGKQTKLY